MLLSSIPTLGGFTFRKAIRLRDDNGALIRMFQEIGILHKNMCCTGCQSAMRLQESSHFSLDGFAWRCPTKSCKKRLSVRKDSYFANAHLTMGKCFMLLFCYFRYKNMLHIHIADIAEVTKNAISEWAIFIRETISHYFLKNPLVLGQHHAVQIDESLFGGKRKYHHGNHQLHEHSWVFGIVEEETKLCVLWMVDNRKRKTLLPLIKDHIFPGAIVKSDQWKPYEALNQSGYEHLTVNHSVQFVTSEGIHTQAIESLWSQVKSGMKIKRGTSTRHLAGYLDLFSFQRLAEHRKITCLDAFIELIQVGSCF
jgi:hypothetical protein